MGKQTGIQWCDDTVNPTSGCDGCELWKYIPKLLRAAGPCYAGNSHEGRLSKAMPKLYAPEFTEVRLIPGRMAKAVACSDLTGTDRPKKPWLNGMPRMIFVEDMGDLFSKAVPFEFIHDEVVQTALSPKGRRHILMLLTKQPARMAEFSIWLQEQGIECPENLWAGASVTSEKTANRAETLCYVHAPVKYLSVEPMLGPVDFAVNLLRNFALVIVGGESDQHEYEGRPFDVAWARLLRDRCREAGVSYFLKQLGSCPYDSTHRISIDGPDNHAVELNLRDSHGGSMSEWPQDLRVREMPRVAERITA